MDQFHWRDRMPKKRMPAAERRQETEDEVAQPSSWSSRITGRIPGRVPSGRERVLTWAGEPLKTNADERRNRRTS